MSGWPRPQTSTLALCYIPSLRYSMAWGWSRWAARGRVTRERGHTLGTGAISLSGQHSPHCCEGAPRGPVAARGLCTALRASDSIKHRLRTEGPRNHRQPSASLFLSAFPVTQHPIWCHFTFYGNWQVQLWVEGFRYKVYFFKL